MSAPLNVLQVCDHLGWEGSRMHGVKRLFSWMIPRFDPERYNVSLVSLRKKDLSEETLESNVRQDATLVTDFATPTTTIGASFAITTASRTPMCGTSVGWPRHPKMHASTPAAIVSFQRALTTEDAMKY